jgi:hypothetical protein
MADIEEMTARMDLEAELIALVEAQTERPHFPGILIHFVPPLVDGKPAPLEPKCTCKVAPGKVLFCRCRCGKFGDERSAGPAEPEPFGAAYRKGANAAEGA